LECTRSFLRFGAGWSVFWIEKGDLRQSRLEEWMRSLPVSNIACDLHESW
jgi:hypothetical protein